MRVPSIRNGFRIGVLVWEAGDGLWCWRGIWVGGAISGGFGTRAEAVDDVGLYCGERYLWPDVIGPEGLVPNG